MAPGQDQEEIKKESPHTSDYNPATANGSQGVVLNDSMQSKNGQVIKSGGSRGNDNSQTRPVTQNAPANNALRTSENFYNGSGAKTSTGQQSTNQTAEKSGTPQTP